MAFNIFIEPIENYSDMVDLLSNMPVLKERLENLKKIEDHVLSQLGTLDEVRAIQAQKDEALTKLEEAKEIKAAAAVDASNIMATAQIEANKIKAQIDSEMADYQRRMKEIAEREHAVEVREGDARLREAKLGDQETRMDKKLKDIVDRESVLQETDKTLKQKRDQTMAIWNS